MVSFIIFIILLHLLPILASPSPTPTVPNIIFIVADDLGHADIQFNDSPCNIRTPNLNTLANNSIVLQNYYVMHLCSPSRSIFLGGRHPIHNGLQHQSNI